MRLKSAIVFAASQSRWTLRRRETRATTNHAVSAWIYFRLTVAVKCIDASLFFFLRSCEYSTRHFVLQLYATCRDYVLYFVEFFSPIFHSFFNSLYRRSDAGKASSFLARAKNVEICITGQRALGEVGLPDAAHLRSASQFYECFNAINLKAPVWIRNFHPEGARAGFA